MRRPFWNTGVIRVSSRCCMGIFDPAKPKRVSQDEFKIIMEGLYGKLEEAERIEVEKLFRADLYEPGIEEGISQPEFESAIAWLKENRSKHVLEESDIAVIERYFTEHLQD